MLTEIPPFIRKPAASLIKGIVSLRNWAYDYEFFDRVHLSKPVISVGNLSMGGVGKTPFVAKLIELCREKGLRPAIIARNYRARSQGVHKILLNYKHPQFDPASFYGDEPFMLAEKFPDVPVFTGPLKYFTASVADKMEDIDILIIDDGFQHRALNRDFEIVLVDCSRPDEENKIFPEGHLREDFSSLDRADLVVLTKTELASPEQIEKLQKMVPEAIPNLQTRSSISVRNSGKKYLALAGIAHPQQFFSSLKSAGIIPKGFLSFSDHHPYNESDIEKIRAEMRLVEADAIITTEKDAVKLRAFNKSGSEPLWIQAAELNVEFLSEPRGLNAFLDQCAGH